MIDTTSAAPSLLPCPFCLRRDTVRVHPPTCDRSTPYNPEDRAFPIVCCHGCGASMDGEDWDQSGRTAAETWNRRAQPTPPAVVEPLTSEQLQHHIEEFGLFCDYEEFEQIARAIERAHGIGIKKGESNGN